VIDVTPPIPASFRIGRQVRARFGLRVENNEMVGIGPGIISGVIDEMSVDVADVLLAAMERDVDAARSTVLAVLRNENITGIAQA
jgi:hypothetical protein